MSFDLALSTRTSGDKHCHSRQPANRETIEMPTQHCSWGTCNSDSRYKLKDHMQGVFFLRIPDPLVDLEKYNRWVHLCGRPDFTVKSKADFSKARWRRFICSKHFVGGSGPTEMNPDPIPAHYTKEQVMSLFPSLSRSHTHVELCYKVGYTK